MICSRCGKNNDDREYRFCVNCGAALAGNQHDATLILPDRDADSGSRLSPEPGRLGQIVDANYRLESVLGKGTTGTVYRATRLKFGDEVAVKLIDSANVADTDTAERFRAAAQTVVRLKHPGAVTLYDFGVAADGSMYLVTELVEGQSLRQIINEQKPMEIKLVAEINSQVCSALDEAHRIGIVHGDIKPDNIIVRTTSGGIHVKVLDFGVTKLRTLLRADPDEATLGNPRYFSPEELMGEALDGRSDVYSWGIVLYEMLSGVVPFNAPTATASIVQKVTQAAPLLRTVNPHISPAVEAVIMSALSKDRESRPRLASSLAQQLDRAVYGGQENQVTAVAPAPVSPSVVTQVRSAKPVAEIPGTIVASPVPAPERFATAQNDPSRSTQAVPAAKKRSRLPLVIAGLAVLIITVGVVAGIFIAPMFLAQSNGNKNAGNQNQGNGKTQTTPTPAPET
ncbi:MAG: serine/threonine-protein kinase, partial [Pyrinomonadaceae bacterium]